MDFLQVLHSSVFHTKKSLLLALLPRDTMKIMDFSQSQPTQENTPQAGADSASGIPESQHHFRGLRVIAIIAAIILVAYFFIDYEKKKTQLTADQENAILDQMAKDYKGPAYTGDQIDKMLSDLEKNAKHD